MNTRLSMKLAQALLGAGIAMLLSIGSSHATPLDLGTAPLYLTSRVDPNVLLMMSVETPMGGAAYADNLDTTPGYTCGGRVPVGGGDNGPCYVANREYLGYFDPNKCYTYNATDNRFDPAAITGANHTCSGQWSGNFLNWATMTAIDSFINTLTGGNRIVDTTSMTVVRRARKYQSDNWFPYKIVDATYNVAPSTVTPYADARLYIYNNNPPDHFTFRVGTTRGGTDRASALRVAAKVCDPSAPGGVESNCVAYTDGTGTTYYKPEGVIQRNATNKRFGVIAYTLDNSETRQGGVLRSDMKYVGPLLPDGSTNTRAEYGTDGILINNPDNDLTLNTGVINYINQFSDPGYKSYDPISELYYEALRYFKNLPPTAECYSGLTTAQYGGFRIVTNPPDPIQYRCQKNFIVGINDANPWLDKRVPGTAFTSPTITTSSGGTLTLAFGDYGEPTDAAAANVDATYWTNLVGTHETITPATWQSDSGPWTSTTASGILDGVGGGPDATNTWDGNCFTAKTVTNLGRVMGTCPSTGKQNSYYIAGLAYFANTENIRPGYPGLQPGQKITISNFFVDTQEYSQRPLDGPRNMLWLAGKYGGFRDLNGNNRPDLQAEWDADGDGVPDNYVFASRPQNLRSGLNRAFVDIDSRVSSAAALAVNSFAVTTGTTLFQALFNSQDWSGDLRAVPIDPTTGNLLPESWRASVANASLTSTSSDSRRVLTRNDTRGIPFQWTTSGADALTAIQQAALNQGDGFGQTRLNYLRGQTGNETLGSTPYLRPRGGAKFGDIVHSPPTYVGQAVTTLPDSIEPSTPHSTFRTTPPVSTRSSMVYFGSNDGMLHGLETTGGTERIAYVPNAVFPNLHELASPAYQHRYYVDGPITVGDAFADGVSAATSFPACGGPCWRTVLVGALGGGGKGIYALDVTNPSTANFVESNASDISLWEFTESSPGAYEDVNTNSVFDAGDRGDLGYTYGEATIFKMRSASGSRWAAIFGNGYNSASERAVLFVVDVRSGALIRKIVLDNTVGGSNGLSTPSVVDIDGDYVADYIYAGDLRGNLWKVDVTDPNENNWRSVWEAPAVLPATTPTPVPLFRAVDGAGVAQPITTRPVVGIPHPGGQTGSMVYFGTGKFIESGDNVPRTSPRHTFYGVWDQNVSTGTTPPVTRSDLLAQTMGRTTATASGGGTVNVRTVTNNPILWRTGTTGPGYLGWRIDMYATGEMIAVDPVYLDSSRVNVPRVIITTLIPSSTACTYGGTSALIEVRPDNGGQLPINVFDVNQDGIIDPSDVTSTGGIVSGIETVSGILSEPVVLNAPAGGGGGVPPPPCGVEKYQSSTEGTIQRVTNGDSCGPLTSGTGRRGWRQLK